MTLIADSGALYALYDADASVMATAERFGVHRVLTVDERHFRAVLSKDKRPFTLVPADES